MSERLALMDARVMDDPSTYYQDLLTRAPFQDTETGLWVVARDVDVRAILPDTENYSNQLTLFPHYKLCDEAMAILGELRGVPATTAGGDGEVHDRARAAIRDTFPTSVVRAERTMGSIVRSRVGELVSGLPDRAAVRGGEVDLIHDFAWELPLKVNLDILGFPPEKYEQIKEWSMGQIALTWGKLEPDEQVRCAQGLVNLWKECQALVAARKALWEEGQELPDDMVSKLLQNGLTHPDNALSDDEIASVILNFAVAGHETTANAIGNAAYHILSQPGKWEELAANQHDKAYVSRVVESELSINPPIIGWSRLAKEDVEVQGQRIVAGSRVLLLIGAANQDNLLYLEPQDRPERRPSDHLSFGLGAHFCVGAPLARIEIAEALSQLAAAYPHARLQEGFAERVGKYYANLGFRALRELPVVIA